MLNNSDLTMKKLMLTAWSKTLLSKGIIDLAKYNRMVALIDKLRE